MPAALTDSASEAMGVNATLQIRFKFLSDVARERLAVSLATALLKAIEVVTHNAEKHRLFGAVLLVFVGGARGHTRVLCTWRTTPRLP